MKHLDNGALVKDYDTPEKEIVQAYQVAVSQVTFEDERFLVSCLRRLWAVWVFDRIEQERAPPDLKVDFPVGEKVLFLGDMHYGLAAQVSAVNEEAQTLSVILAVSSKFHYFMSI